jgi:hypothetical protein
MNGNTPYAGRDDVVEAGKRMPADVPESTPEQRAAMRADASDIAARTRSYLPDEYTVGSEVTSGAAGPKVTVAVRPPVGNPVRAGFEPEFDGDVELDDEERTEVARGLAAGAALQVKLAVGEDADLAAR